MVIDKTVGARQPGAAYVDREGAYLLTQRDGLLVTVRTPKGLFLPGGGLKPGESHGDCILRECLEELGCPGTAEQYLGAAEGFWIHSLGYPFHPVQYYYAGMLGEFKQAAVEADHVLELVPAETALTDLILEMQRWAVSRFLKAKVKNVSEA